MSADLTRKEFLQWLGLSSAAFVLPGLAAESSQWQQGDLVHILPTVNHQRFLIKTSFKKPQQQAPRLRVGNDIFGSDIVAGTMKDTAGRFWAFEVKRLKPATEYQLQILDHQLNPQTDCWPLKTFPAPNASPQRLRILSYTCAGGNEEVIEADGVAHAIPLAHRQELLQRALAEKPDLLIANGDHVYWDERTMSKYKPQSVIDAYQRAFDKHGQMQRQEPILGHNNETILTGIVDQQIAHLYGVMLRSTPVFMLTDDHDLFDNDEAKKEYITLPPDSHMLEAARTVQSLYYPEYLPYQTQPGDLPGSGGKYRSDDLSETFGTVRYGNLFEAVLYDTKRYVSIDGEQGKMVPDSVEAWLAKRTKSDDSTHFVHIPSTPIAWSAGKWGEWYPDLLDAKTGKLSLQKQKPHWPSGWWDQHQRILAMLGQQKKRIPIILSGDLHMSSAAKISESGDLNFVKNPIHAIVVGTLGSGAAAYPSRARGVLPQVPSQMQAEEYVRPVEKNGFTIIDINADSMNFNMYTWRSPELFTAIANLRPAYVFSLSEANK